MVKDGCRWKYLDVQVPAKGPLRRSGLQCIYTRKRSLMLSFGMFWHHLSVELGCMFKHKRGVELSCVARGGKSIWGRERERDEQQLRASASVAADDTESAVATWDAYGPCNSDCDMAVVPGEGSIAEEPKPDGLVPGGGCITEEPKPDGSLCAMCLFAAMQKGKESTNMQVKKALTKSQQRYLETGYKELEKLTHENYEQCP